MVSLWQLPPFSWVPGFLPPGTCVSPPLNPLEHAFSTEKEGISPKGAKMGSWVSKKKGDMTVACGPPNLNPI